MFSNYYSRSENVKLKLKKLAIYKNLQYSFIPNRNPFFLAAEEFASMYELFWLVM